MIRLNEIAALKGGYNVLNVILQLIIEIDILHIDRGSIPEAFLHHQTCCSEGSW